MIIENLNNSEIQENATKRSKDPIKGSQESSCEKGIKGRRQAPQEEEGDLCHLHLQGIEAGPPRHRYIEQGNEHYELICQRYL